MTQLIFAKLHSLLAWIYLHQDELLVSALWATIAAMLLVARKMAILPFVIAWNAVDRLRGRDDYKSIYGKWHCYRVAKRPKGTPPKIYDTWYVIKPRVLTRYPKCIFYSSHMTGKELTVVDGYCRIYDKNLAIVLSDKPRAKGQSYNGPTLVILKNFGDPSFTEFKVGSMCGTASGGDIVAGDVLFSKDPITDNGGAPLSAINACIDPFSRWSVDVAIANIDKLRAAITPHCKLEAPSKHQASIT